MTSVAAQCCCPVLLLYNGDRPWPGTPSRQAACSPVSELDLGALIGLEPGHPLWRCQPTMRYYLVDEGGFSPELVAATSSLLAVVFGLDMAPDRSTVAELARLLLERLAAQREGLAEEVLNWFGGSSAAFRLDLEPGDLPLGEVKTMLAKNMQRWDDEIRAEALQEGRAEGREEGLLLGQRRLLRRTIQARFGQAVLEACTRALDEVASPEVLESPHDAALQAESPEAFQRALTALLEGP